MGFFPLWLKKKLINLSSPPNQNKYEIKIWQSLKSISQLNEVATPKLPSHPCGFFLKTLYLISESWFRETEAVCVVIT